MLSLGEPFIAAKFSQSYCDMGMGPCCLRMSARALETKTKAAHELTLHLKGSVSLFIFSLGAAKARTRLFSARRPAANCSDRAVSSPSSSSFCIWEHAERSFAERNTVGCVSISSNWVEFECFSDCTRCTLERLGALEGREWKERGKQR